MGSTAWYYYQNELLTLIQCFPSRRFTNLEIANKLGEETARKYHKIMKPMHHNGLIKPIEKVKIYGHRHSHVWEIPIHIVEKVTKNENKL